MNTIAEFCELFCHLDNSKLMGKVAVASSSEPKRLAWLPLPPQSPMIMDHTCHDKDDALSEVPLLVALEGSDETSDSSDTEDGSSSSSLCVMDEPELESDDAMMVAAPARKVRSRRVSFHTLVAVREHAVTVGVGSTMMDTDELPLQLDWSHADTTYRCCLATSKHRRVCDRGGGGPPRLSLDMRRERLKRVSRYTDQELDRIVTGTKAFSLLSLFNL
jgi:hypothetical protein